MTAPGPDRLLVTETILNDRLAAAQDASELTGALTNQVDAGEALVTADFGLGPQTMALHMWVGAGASWQPVLEGKSDVGHTHTTAQVTGLDTALTGKAPLSHAHTTSHVNGLDTALSQRVRNAGTATTVWSGSQSAYDALAPATRNAAGFIAVIT